jgi:ribosomal protein S20
LDQAKASLLEAEKSQEEAVANLSKLKNLLKKLLDAVASEKALSGTLL